MMGRIIAGFIWSGIGLAAFVYGKGESSLRIMLIGGALMVFPYVVTNMLAIYAIGGLLTAALFIPHD